MNQTEPSLRSRFLTLIKYKAVEFKSFIGIGSSRQSLDNSDSDDANFTDTGFDY